MKTAVQRGVENAAQIAAQAKTKKSQKKYQITTDQQEFLVDSIANMGVPLNETSGLRDLRDAIHSRKEIDQYHKLARTLDPGHSFFNSVLQTAQSKLTALVNLIPAALKTHEIEDDASNFIFLHFRNENSDDDHGGPEEATSKSPKAGEGWREKPKTVSMMKKRADTPLSKEEAELQCEFLVLCFLYELNRVRDIIRDVWILYRQGSVNAITASLVTDLAQSYVQQNVAALEEDLASYTPSARLALSETIRKLYKKMTATPTLLPQVSSTALRHLMCIDSLNDMEAHLDSKTSHGRNGKHGSAESTLPSMPFLKHFDSVRQKKVSLPIWDKFTEGMVRRTNTPDASLPFGLQIVMDVYEIMRDDYRKLFKDITGHGFDIARLIRLHVDYEDHMWAIGRKPDYMSKGNLKFTNVYLSSLDKLLNWTQELLKTDNSPTSSAGMTTDVFVSIHSTLAGLSMWNFNKTYHGFSIAKTRWFVTSLAHLYNAAKQIGGLEVEWPDLEYIIKMHGSDRIFTGSRPTDPKDFYERYMISNCVPSHAFSKDCRLTGSHHPEVSPEIRKKRGPIAHFPLEEAINGYYGPDTNDDRWIKRHAVFNYLHHQSVNGGEQLRSGDVEPHQTRLKELQNTFGSIVNELARPKTKNLRKITNRVKRPDFSQKTDDYAGLLLVMRSELQAHEVHSNFDYLSFYRRAYDLVLKVRSQVLFDHALQVARRSDISQGQDPDNRILLGELLHALKIKPEDKKIQATGDKVSKDVVPLDQLKRIATIMESAILAEGSVELDRAKMRLSYDWEGLEAEYAAEEARTRDPSMDDGTELPDTISPLNPGRCGETVAEREGPPRTTGKLTVKVYEHSCQSAGHCPDEPSSATGNASELGSESENEAEVKLHSARPSSAPSRPKDADTHQGTMPAAELSRGTPVLVQYQAYVSDAVDEDRDSWNEVPKDPASVIEVVLTAPDDDKSRTSSILPQLSSSDGEVFYSSVVDRQTPTGNHSVETNATDVLGNAEVKIGFSDSRKGLDSL